MAREIDLMEENELAWRLFLDARFPGRVSGLLGELELVSLTLNEAHVLASKIRAVATTIGDLEAEKRREEIERAKNANR